MYEEQAVDGFRISPQQKRVWLLHPPGEQAGEPYGVHAALSVDGPLDAEALGRALDLVLERNEVLRTVLRRPPGLTIPVQVIGEPERHVLDPVDLPAAELALRIERGAPLPSGPLGLELLRLAADRHVLLVSLPASHGDPAGLADLVLEIARAYAFCRGEGEAPPEDRLQYADFAEWQIQMLESEESAPGREHWSRRDLSRLGELRLPFEASVEAGADGPFRPRFRTAPVPAGLEKALEEQADALGVSLTALLLAGWTALLERLLDRAGITVGVLHAGRRMEELQHAQGLFARYLPVPSPIASPAEGPLRWRDYAARIEAELQEAAEWQECFAWEEPLVFPFAFDPEEPPVRHEAAGAVFSLAHRRAVLEGFTARLGCRRTDGGALELEIGYDESRLAAGDADRLAESLLALLADAAGRPEAEVADLTALGERERQRVLEDFNRTEPPAPADRLLHRLFESRAALEPDRPAVFLAGRRLSYGELNARANRLARHLRELGAGPERAVGICLERSPEMVVALLATLKAGGAYVPLDPAYPRDRLEFLLRDAAAPVLVTTSRLAEALPEHAARTVLLDADAIESQPAEDLEGGAGPENLAYVIYTSGSTGTPKGVGVAHAQLLASTAARTAWYREPVGVYFLASSFSFDSSVAGIFWALSQGGALALPHDDFQRDLPGTLRFLDDSGVTHLLCLPSLYNLLLEQAAPGQLAALRVAIVAGEACARPLVERHFARFPGVSLCNEYGPTEGTVWCTAFDCGELGDLASVPIGRPVPGYRIRLLDRGLEPVPIGAPGELFVGGGGISRGYLGRPDLTAARFIPDPFGETGDRLYRTGDLARWRPDGIIEFLGRADHQVKIRGYRIELGEIEAALAAHPGVREAVVTAREDTPGDRRLVAYAVPRDGSSEVDAAGLQAFLQERLPSYMVPAAFVLLGRLPQTANGKVDRAALPAPDLRSTLVREYVAPENEAERVLADVWAEVLGVERVGALDSFFDLGGDSILSVRARALAEKRGLHFTVQQLFQHRTVRSLVPHVQTLETAEAERGGPFSLVSEEDRRRMPADAEDAYPLSALQAGMVFHSEADPGSAVYHDIVSVHLRAPFDAGALRATLDRAAADHPALRTSFHTGGFGEVLQIVHREVEIPLGIEDLSHLSEEEQEAAVAAWIEEEKGRPFDWTRPPLLRIQVHRRGEDRFQLSVSEHHAILDGWSMATLLTEMFQDYLARLGVEGASPQTAPTVRFRDFIALEREARASPETQAFWSAMLAEAPAGPLPWREPFDEPRRVIHRQVPLSREVSDGLARLASLAGAPLKSALLAAHVRALDALTGRPDVITGLVSNGRPETADGDRVLGLFLNTLPFRLRLPQGTWIDLVRATAAAENEMLPHRRFPMAELQRRFGGGAPLFDTAFNFVHFHVYERLAALPGVGALGWRAFEETNFPLTANFHLEGGRVLLTLLWSTTDFDERRTEEIAGLYGRLLEAMAADPEGRCDAEHARLLLEGPPSTGPGLPVHLRVEEQARLRPGALALEAGAERLTYAELAVRARRLARLLMRLGAGPEARVAVCLERSPDLAVAALAALEAGAAWLPLDPAHPPERLRSLLSEAGAVALVTRAGLLETDGLPIVRLDADREALERESAEPLETAADPLQVAYVIYTSGSTGRPKGVEVTHAGLAGLVDWHLRVYGVGPDDRATLLAGPAFDASVWELWPYLAAGAAVLVPGDQVRADPRALAGWMAAQGVTLAFAPTPLAQLLVSADWPADSSLRALLTGGEALRVRPLPGLPFALVNHYGPTEGTVVATWGEVEAGGSAAPPSIGRPIDGARAVLLDPLGRRVPAGVPGELAIGGPGLARGYLGRPDLTAERFVPDPFCGRPGERLYRTGDLARLLPSGELAFLGRSDRQVKIRGHRVEPAEAEAALLLHPGVREAIVDVIPDAVPASDGLALAAWIVPRTAAPEELEAFLLERLPAPWVPRAWVFLDALPLTPNGKIDRRALPAPGAPERTAAVPPRDAVELALARIWEELLGRPAGVTDHFFDLGGHSLLAIRLAARIRERFGRDLPLGALLAAPTLEQQAALLRQEGPLSAGILVPLRNGTLPRPLFLVHAAGGNALCYLDLARRLGIDRPVYGLQSPVLAGEIPPGRVEEMAARYVREVRAVQPEGPYLLGGWSSGGVVAFEMARQLTAAGEEVERVILIDSLAPAPDGDGELDEATLRGLFGIEVPGERDGGSLFEMFRAHVRAVRSYEPRPLAAPVLLVRGAEPPAGRRDEPSLGWDGFAAGGIEVLRVPGNHHGLLAEPHVGPLSEALRTALSPLVSQSAGR